MFGGGDYGEVARWLRNFVGAHARREVLPAEAVVEAERAREGASYGVRVRAGDGLAPPAGDPPLELAFAEVARGRGSLEWCAGLAGRVRGLARAAAGRSERTPA